MPSWFASATPHARLIQPTQLAEPAQRRGAHMDMLMLQTSGRIECLAGCGVLQGMLRFVRRRAVVGGHGFARTMG